MNSQGGSREEPRRPRTSSGSVLVGEERRHWASDWRVPQLDSLATRLNRAQDGRDADGVGVVGDGRAGEGWIRGAEWFVRSGEMYDGDAGKRMDRARRWMGPQRADLRRGGGAQRCRGDGVQRSAAQTSGEPNGRQPAPRRPFSEHQHQRPVGVEPLGRRRSVSVHGEVLWRRGPGACWKRPLKVRVSPWPRRWAAVVLGPAAIRRPQRRYPAGSAPRIDVWAPAPATTNSAGPRCSCPPLPDATGWARHSGAALRRHARGDPMAAGPGGPALR